MSDRFWSKVDKRHLDECWPWKACVVSTGYGQFYFEGRTQGAHRVAFRLTHGVWPNIARHTCDNRICVNPNHILDGDVSDNVRDAIERGRWPGNGFKDWTHCKHGHPFDSENTAYNKKTGQRICRTCRRDWLRDYRAGKKVTL